MSNATRDVKTNQFGTPEVVIPQLLNFPAEAATTIFAGTMVATNAAGNAIPASTAGALKVWGRAERQVVNTTAAGFGAAGALTVEIHQGWFYFSNDTTNPVAVTNRGQYVYAVDDNTVGTSDLGGTLPLAGYVYDVPSTGKPEFGKVAVACGMARPDASDPEIGGGGSNSFKARAVALTNQSTTAFTGVTGGTPLDGVTMVAGQIVLFVGQTTASQNGPWMVGTIVAGAAPLTRPDWYPSAGAAVAGSSIEVTEGTAGAGTAWRLATTGAIVIDTTATTWAIRPFANTFSQVFSLGAGCTVRSVVTSNVSSLAAFTGVTGGTILDGVTLVAGQLVLLAAQTTASQNGVYVVGAIAANAAPLTRPDWLATGSILPEGFAVQVAEGFAGAGTLWGAAAATLPITIDTTATTFAIVNNGAADLGLFKARAVVTANTSLTAFAGVAGGSTTNTDGVTAVAGDVVLLAAQTTATQNGPYVVGTVAAGAAPLTRPPWWATGSTQNVGQMVTVSGEGTVYKNTEWKAMAAASTIVVDTTDPKFYPKKVTWTSALVGGIVTAGASSTSLAPSTAFVFSVNTICHAERKTPNTATATIMYSHNTGGVAAGVGTTGAASVFATVAAGTVNASDVSTMIVTYDNQI